MVLSHALLGQCNTNMLLYRVFQCVQPLRGRSIRQSSSLCDICEFPCQQLSKHDYSLCLLMIRKRQCVLDFPIAGLSTLFDHQEELWRAFHQKEYTLPIVTRVTNKRHAMLARGQQILRRHTPEAAAASPSLTLRPRHVCSVAQECPAYGTVFRDRLTRRRHSCLQSSALRALPESNDQTGCGSIHHAARAQ